MNRKDFGLGVVMGLISLFYLWQAYQLPVGGHWLNSTRAFPLLLGFSLCMLSIVCIIQSIWRRAQEKETSMITKAMLIRGAFFLIVTTIYLVIYPIIGFFIATFLYVTGMLLFYREIKWYQALLVAAGTLLFIHLVFERLLFLPLPA